MLDALANVSKGYTVLHPKTILSYAIKDKEGDRTIYIWDDGFLLSNYIGFFVFLHLNLARDKR